MSVMSFLQKFMSVCDACEIHEGVAMRLFKQFLTSLSVATVKGRVTLMHFANLYHAGALKSSSDIIQFVLMHYVTYKNIAKLDMIVLNRRQ